MNFKHFNNCFIDNFSPVAANAACALSNLAGTWSVYSGSTNTQFGGYGYGKLTFNTTGALTVSSAVSFLELKGGTKITFKSGSIKMLSNCIPFGTLTTTNNITFNFTNARLNNSKNTILGVYDRTDGDYGMINLIR